MIAAAKLVGKVLLEMPVEMTPDIIQSLRDFVETKRSPKHLVELKALKSVNSHLEKWSASDGVETAGIELMRLVWRYLGLHYEWTVRAEKVRNEKFTDRQAPNLQMRSLRRLSDELTSAEHHVAAEQRQASEKPATEYVRVDPSPNAKPHVHAGHRGD